MQCCFSRPFYHRGRAWMELPQKDLNGPSLARDTLRKVKPNYTQFQKTNKTKQNLQDAPKQLTVLSQRSVQPRTQNSQASGGPRDAEGRSAAWVRRTWEGTCVVPFFSHQSVSRICPGAADQCRAEQEHDSPGLNPVQLRPQPEATCVLPQPH